MTMQKTVVRPEARDIAELPLMLLDIYQYKADWKIQMRKVPGGDGATARRCYGGGGVCWRYGRQRGGGVC